MDIETVPKEERQESQFYYSKTKIITLVRDKNESSIIVSAAADQREDQMDVLVVCKDLCSVIRTLVLLLDRVESLLIPDYILLTDQFVVPAIRTAVRNFSVYHFLPLKRADCRVCAGQIICEDIALFVSVCNGNVKFSYSVKYLQNDSQSFVLPSHFIVRSVIFFLYFHLQS